jgi:succinate dehydrogenase/fumarate reductase flavoprotein subunit
MTEQLDCDLLVLGAGMAGLTAGARAAARSARVIVVEKAAETGGSAAMSGAVFWTLQSVDKLAYVTGGRRDLLDLLLGGYAETMAWIRARGIAVSAAMDVMNGQGYQIDIIAYFQDCIALIEQAGGYVALSSNAAELLRDETGAVTGAIVDHADGAIHVSSPWTILATGGFQGSPELRGRYVGDDAPALLLRSNTASIGEGVELGLAAGGQVAANPGFYGHLVAVTKEWGDPRLFNPLSQHHSAHGLLINRAGRRFCDESRFDHVNNQEVMRQPTSRALLVWDDRIQQEHVLRPFLKVSAILDRFELALRHGTPGGSAPTLDALADLADGLGFDGRQTAATVAGYNQALAGDWENLSPVRADHRLPVDRAPFFALVVRPAITYSFGGLTIDTGARVLDGQGQPIPGLLAAGADAGDTFREGYAGGLAQAAGLAIAAVKTAGYL